MAPWHPVSCYSVPLLASVLQMRHFKNARPLCFITEAVCKRVTGGVSVCHQGLEVDLCAGLRLAARSSDLGLLQLEQLATSDPPVL